MAFLLRSRLFGFLIILAALPGPAAALTATGAPPGGGPDPDGVSVEARLSRIAEALREREGLAQEAQAESSHGRALDLLAAVFVNGPRVGWRNGGFGNGGFRNGGFWNGGFRNGGFGNGGFRNGGGFRNFW